MGNADDGHLGPLNGVSIPATYTQELVLTRNTGNERTQCKPSLGSEQQLNPEAQCTQKRLSSHNLTLSHKKESTQLSKAQACWHKHRCTKWLLVYTSTITMWVGITHFVPSSILSFVTFMTGFYGLAASEFHIRFWNPQQQAQSTQQQAQMMIDNLLTRRVYGYLTATMALVVGLATIVPAALRCYVNAEGAGSAMLNVNGTDFRCMVQGGWLLTYAVVSYSMACIASMIVCILSSDCSAENHMPVSVAVDSQSTSGKHVGESCLAWS